MIHREGQTFTIDTLVVVEPAARLTIFGGGATSIAEGDVVLLRMWPARWRAVLVHADDVCWHAKLVPAPAGDNVIEFRPRPRLRPVLPPAPPLPDLRPRG